MEQTEVVRIENLCKRYTKGSDYAVRGVGFSLAAGEIVGLLGHNGAGKSTTLKCLEGMLPFDEGRISVCGRDLVREPVAAKSRMGFVTDNHAVFVRMTGTQYLRFMADVYKVPNRVRGKRFEELESVFRLGDSVNRLISSYSHGMRQKICMMGSLMHEPKLWILDEPMTGLDPRTMRAVSDYMRGYAERGNAILFSSHDLNSVEKICGRAVVIEHGRQTADISIGEFRRENPDFDLEEFFFHEEQD